jgi:hypothetical protein
VIENKVTDNGVKDPRSMAALQSEGNTNNDGSIDKSKSV